jgi:tetratricopeptide (TPR) repeat protein
MKVASLVVVPFFLLSTIDSAQTPEPNVPFAPRGETVVLTGTVTTESNSPPGAIVEVTLDCMGTRAAQTNTDSHGNFSLNVRRSSSIDDSTDSRNSSTDFSKCEINANLNGYRAEPLHVAAGGSEVGVANVGTILLHPTAQAHAFTISVNSLAAPEKAKAAFEKGEEQKKKGKLAAAMESFRKAIAAYPRYALAWLELGRVQATQNEFADAQHSFQQSVAQDAKLVDGYVELARLAARQNDWQGLLRSTKYLVEAHPDVAEFWFWNAVASFNLGDINAAESGITRGLRIDSAHRLPQMEYLYALVLAHAQKFNAAADHVTTYLKLAPGASDAAEAQKRLVQFQGLASSAGTR